jgi:hypothetical protein
VVRKRVLVVCMPCLDHALDPPSGSSQHAADLVGLGRRQGQEANLSAMLGRIGVDAVDRQRVEMYVQASR